MIIGRRRLKKMTKRDRYLLVLTIGLMILFPFLIVFIRERVELRPRAQFGNVTLALSPTQASLAPGGTTTFDFSIDSGAFPLSGMDISFDFNSDVINITGITINAASGFTDTLINEIGQASTRLAIVARKPTTQLPKGNITIATLTVSALNTGTSPLEIRPTEIVGFNGVEEDVRLNVGGKTDARIIVSTGITPTVTLPPGVTPSPTPTLPPGVTPTPIIPPNTPLITFKTDFVGMGHARPDLTVRLTVVDELQLQPTQNVYRPIVSAGADSKYRPLQSPLPLIGVAPGQGKTILLKGPKHLQNKVANRIELKAGNNGPFDWTAENLKLEPGDLPNPNYNMAQDGVVNAVDVALLVERISSSSSTDLQVADLNYDGVVNANDLSLMIETLSTKYDDEF